MIFRADVDGSHLSEPQSKSTVASFFYLSDATPNPPLNGAIDIGANILKEITSSAADTEIAGTYHMGQRVIPLRHTLIELGHAQPPSGKPIKTDNSVAKGFANGTICQRKTKAMDMRYYWVQDRTRQKKLHIYWAPGDENLADYFTKHHPPSYHPKMRPVYLHET